MTLERNENGPEVLKLQRALLDMGCVLPKWGPDGWLGRETMAALARLFSAHGEPFNQDADAVSDEQLAFVYNLQASLNGAILRPVSEGNFFDVRQQAGNQHDYGERPWSAVTGVCLHQTACVLGEKPARWASVGAHIGISRMGKVMRIHDFNRLIVHGNGWNTHCVGIEMDGMYAGIEGDFRTFWRPPGQPNLQPQSPTPELIDAAKATIRWIKAVVEQHGGKLNALVAHRQSSGDRESDPGSALWQAVALPLHKELSLTDGGIGFKLGTGYAIPREWDPRCEGTTYWS